MYIYTKFTYNEYIGPYFLSHVVLRFLPVNSPNGEYDHTCDNFVQLGLFKQNFRRSYVPTHDTIMSMYMLIWSDEGDHPHTHKNKKTKKQN
jgi:hypothetical protein